MEANKIKKIITAIGNPRLNEELKKIKYLQVINKDIFYQEGILEILELNNEIDFLIINQFLPGKLKLEELIENIYEINKKIKIIILIQKYDETLEKILIKNEVFRVFDNEKIETKDILEIINQEEKMEKYNEEIRKEINELKKYIDLQKKENKNNIKKQKNKIKIFRKNSKLLKIKNKIIFILKKIKNKKIINNKEIKNKIIKNIIKNNNIYLYYYKKRNKNNNLNNKIISILGNNGAGKSGFCIMLSNVMKKFYKKILIIDFDILNNSLHTVLGVNRYSEKIKEKIQENNFEEINLEKLIININKKIDLISGINLIFNTRNKNAREDVINAIKKLEKNYQLIIIDTSSECFFDYTKDLIKISSTSVFLTEPNLLELSKSKRILNIYEENWKIDINKINIVFNKFNKNGIKISLLKNIYYKYNILGKLVNDENYNFIINTNFKTIILKNKNKKEIERISYKIINNF